MISTATGVSVWPHLCAWYRQSFGHSIPSQLTRFLREKWHGSTWQRRGVETKDKVLELTTPVQQSVCGKNIERRHEGICCHWNHHRPASSRVNSKLDRVSMQQPSLHVWIRCVCRERVAKNLVRPHIGAWGGRFGRKLTLLPGQKRRETVTLNNGRGQARERERERERDTEEGREKFPALRRYTKATPRKPNWESRQKFVQSWDMASTFHGRLACTRDNAKGLPVQLEWRHPQCRDSLIMSGRGWSCCASMMFVKTL